jgi:hypothetical protein
MIIIGFVVVLLQVLDMSAGDTWALNFVGVRFEQLVVYSFIAVISLFIQVFLLLTTTKIVFRTKKATSRIAVIIAYIYVVSQLIVIGLLAYLVLEQLITSRYHTLVSQLIVGFSLTVSIIIMISLSYTCFKSYSSTRSKLTLVYGIAIIAISAQLISALFYIETSLRNKPEYITPQRNPWISYFYTSLLSNLLLIYNITTIISFVAVWIASVLFTKSYAQKTSKVKYWIAVSIPVIYFLFQYSPVFLNQTGTLSSLLMASGSILPYLNNFILNTANVGSAILFGISFIMLSRALIYDRLKYYLIICGTGIMIIFSSHVSTILILAAFPAWSIISISFMLSASFLILLGLDSATFNIAGDIQIRRFLSKSKQEFELFGALSSTQVSATVEARTRKISKQIYDRMAGETLFVSRSETEDIKQYISEVVAEMKKSGTKSDDSKYHDSNAQSI